MKPKTIKIASILLIVILLVNMVLFALGKVGGLYFWITIAVIGLIAYKVLPSIKK